MHTWPNITLSTAMNLVHRNSFPKLSNFPCYFTQLGKFRGEANDEKHADPGKKNRNSRKSRGNSRNLLEAFLRSRKKENLYGHCDMNNARWILSKGSTPLRGCWFWSKKLHFQKNFGRTFAVVEGVTGSQRESIWAPSGSQVVVTTTNLRLWWDAVPRCSENWTWIADVKNVL